MGKKYRRYKNAIEKYLSSEKGRRFFHIAYSIGASIVIIGALFKINHYPLGTEILMVGLITEAIIFALSAFDTPSKDYKWEEVFPVFNGDNMEDDITGNDVSVAAIPGSNAKGAAGTVIIGSGVSGISPASAVSPERGGTAPAGTSGSGGITGGAFIAGGGAPVIPDTGNITDASEKYAEQLSKLSESMEKFAEITSSLTDVSDTLLNSFKSITDNSEGIGNNTKGYVIQMEALNRNITGLNTIYEIQLKGVSGQIHTIEQINAGLDRIKKLYDGSLVDSSIFKNETEKMAQQLSELNRIYARMLQAMTVNMNMNIPGFGGTAPQQPDQI